MSDALEFGAGWPVKWEGLATSTAEFVIFRIGQKTSDPAASATSDADSFHFVQGSAAGAAATTHDGPPLILVAEDVEGEALFRVPTHTPEWTNANDSDPGTVAPSILQHASLLGYPADSGANVVEFHSDLFAWA